MAKIRQFAFDRPQYGSTAFSRAVVKESMTPAPLEVVPHQNLRRFGWAAILLILLFVPSCSKEKAEETAVPVRVVAAEKTTLQRIVTAEAVLFPLQQSAITPKISAPIRTFYIKRGSPVHRGQLLAVLENSDLAAAAQ